MELQENTKFKNVGVNINGSLSHLALEVIYMVRNRTALTNLVLWTSAKQWPSHGFVMNTQTNFQLNDYTCHKQVCNANSAEA